MKKLFEDIFEYLKEISLPIRIAHILFILAFVFEMLWAFIGVRIYHTYVPVESLFDLYVLAFPFIFSFINIFAVCKKRVGKFLLIIDFVLLVTYPVFLSLVLMMINEMLFY